MNPLTPLTARRTANLKRTARITLAVLAAAALGPGLAESQVRAEKAKPLQYDVSVTLKLVQVYVTGKGGRPVGDLSASEFDVSDNGKPVAVTHFEKHFLGAPDEAPAPAPAAAASPRMVRKFFLLFDFGFLDPRGVLRSKNAGLHFIDTQLRPGDEVGLLTYTTYRGLVLHEYFTPDHARLRRIVEGFGLRRLAGRAENLADFIYTEDLGRNPEPAPSGQAVNAAEDSFQRQARLQTGQQVDAGARQGYVDRARDFVESLQNFALVLRYIPGYKNVILFSGGIARQVLYGKRGGATLDAWMTPDQLATQMSAYDAAQADSGLRDDFSSMVREFRASNAPIYALDVSKIQKESDVTYGEGTGVTVREFDGSDSLRQIASESGGRFFATTVDYKKALEDIQDVTGAYYVLGYSVSEKWDGKFHKIKVKVKRPGCDVAAQGGYFSPKPFKEYTSFEKLLHVTDLALSDSPQLQVPAEMPVEAMALTAGGWTRLMAVGRASRDRMAGVIGKKAEAYLLLTDEKGDVVLIKKYRLDLPEKERQTYFPSFLVSAKPGRYTCRLVLRNMETGAGARGSAPLTVPAPADPAGAAVPAGAIALDPPLLLTPDPQSLDLAGPEADSPSAVFSYDAGTHAPAVGRVPAGTARPFAALRCASNAEPGGLAVTASLLRGDALAGTPVPLSILKEDRKGPVALRLVEIETGALEPGHYLLEFAVSEKSGSPPVRAAAEFDVF